jgi:hypothetical protein
MLFRLGGRIGSDNGWGASDGPPGIPFATGTHHMGMTTKHGDLKVQVLGMRQLTNSLGTHNRLHMRFLYPSGSPAADSSRSEHVPARGRRFSHAGVGPAVGAVPPERQGCG